MILTILILISTIISNNHTDTLTLQVENIESANGSIKLALFNSTDAFLKDDQAAYVKSYTHQSAGTIHIEWPEIAYGTYALAIYHDENDNGKLDKNLFGIPSEPYSFSNNPKIKWRGPQFEESKFDFSENNKKLVLKLRKWSKQ
jgi:uncharacterized protein (DUF2141 family)